MKIYNIKFITNSVKNRMVKINIRNFFLRKDLFKSSYIVANVNAIVGDKNYLLLSRALINLKDRQDKKTFAKKVVEGLSLNNIALGPNSILYISYIDADFDIYNQYKAQIMTLGKKFYFTSSSLGKRFYFKAVRVSKFVFKFINIGKIFWLYSKTLKFADLKMVVVNFFTKFKLILIRIFNIFICNILFRASATGGDLNIPNLNEDGVHTQDTEWTHNVEEFRILARLQGGVDQILEAHNNRSIQELITGYNFSNPTLDRQAQQFINRLNNSDPNINNVVTDMTNSNYSLKSVIGMFDFVTKNKSSFVESNIQQEVAKASNISEILKTRVQTQSVVRDSKPFGEVGDITLNELALKTWEVINPVVDYCKAHPELIKLINVGGDIALRIITPLLVYRSVMRIYNKVNPILNPASVHSDVYLQIRRERLIFSLVGAPLLTGGLINMVIPPLSSISRSGRVIAEGSDKLFSNLEENKNLSFLSILGFKGNKNFNWKWIWVLGFLVLFIIVFIFKYYYNIDIMDITYNTIKSPIFGKYLILVFIIINVLLILRYIFKITLIYLIKQNKITKSVFLPYFLNKIYDVHESLSKSKDLNLLINFYYRLMFMYIFLFFLSLIYYLIFY